MNLNSLYICVHLRIYLSTLKIWCIKIKDLNILGWKEHLSNYYDDAAIITGE